MYKYFFKYRCLSYGKTTHIFMNARMMTAIRRRAQDEVIRIVLAGTVQQEKEKNSQCTFLIFCKYMKTDDKVHPALILIPPKQPCARRTNWAGSTSTSMVLGVVEKDATKVEKD